MIESIKTKIGNKDYDGAKELYEDLLKNAPDDLTSRVEYALLLNSLVSGADSMVFADFSASLKILEDGLKINSTHIPSILLKGFLEFFELGKVDHSTLELANKCIYDYSLHDKYWEQLILLKALYYIDIDKEKFLSVLMESIKDDNLFSYNNYLLYQYYLEKDQFNEAIKYLDTAIKNVKHVLELESEYNPVGFDDFVDESYRGIRTSRSNYDAMIEKMEVLKSSHTR